jgi:hypothetical protein
MTEAVLGDIELLSNTVPVELIVMVVSECGDIWLTIVEDKVDGIVAVFNVELPTVSLVSVCNDEYELIPVPWDAPVL